MPSGHWLSRRLKSRTRRGSNQPEVRDHTVDEHESLERSGGFRAAVRSSSCRSSRSRHSPDHPGADRDGVAVSSNSNLNVARRDQRIGTGVADVARRTQRIAVAILNLEILRDRRRDRERSRHPIAGIAGADRQELRWRQLEARAHCARSGFRWPWPPPATDPECGPRARHWPRGFRFRRATSTQFRSAAGRLTGSGEVWRRSEAAQSARRELIAATPPARRSLS